MPLSGPGAALQPLHLKAFARGSHAARKHMLLAAVESGQEGGPGGAWDAGQPLRVLYLTFAPEAGFGA
jgi:hypothetical protein